MRIGIFTDTYPPYINGVSTSVVMLEKALRKKGHQVYIVTVNADKLSYENDTYTVKDNEEGITKFDNNLNEII